MTSNINRLEASTDRNTGIENRHSNKHSLRFEIGQVTRERETRGDQLKLIQVTRHERKTKTKRCKTQMTVKIKQELTNLVKITLTPNRINAANLG